MSETFLPAEASKLARPFARLGWLGFWTQIVAGVLSVTLMLYVLAFNRLPSGPRAGVALVEYLTSFSLLLLAFTTYWTYRYTRLAGRLANHDPDLSRSSVVRAVWTGLFASSVGVLFSLAVMIIEAAHLLFYFLAMPQGGVPVIQSPAIGAAGWVSAVDMVSLLGLMLTLAAEILVLILSLWLLFRSMRAEQASAEPGAI